MIPVAFAIQAAALRTNPLSGPDGIGVQADHAYTLEARAEVQAIAFDSRQDLVSSTDVVGALGSSSPQAQAVALRGRDGGGTAEIGDNCAFTVRASTGGGDKSHALVQSGVRRLTPTECECLQGFPDGYTYIPYRNGFAVDGPRYKALGNSMATNVMAWIGQRIAAYMARINSLKEAA